MCLLCWRAILHFCLHPVYDDIHVVVFILHLTGEQHHLVYLHHLAAFLPDTREKYHIDFTVQVFQGSKGHGIAFLGGEGA